MHERDGKRFQYRHNRDGSHDTICCDCCVTVGSANDESELAAHEDAHKCAPVPLYQTSQHLSHKVRSLWPINAEKARPDPVAE